MKTHELSKLLLEMLDSGWKSGFLSPLEDGRESQDCWIVDEFGALHEATCSRHTPCSDNPDFYEDAWISNEAITKRGYISTPAYWKLRDKCDTPPVSNPQKSS